VIYIASFSDNIYVLHAFKKKTQKTEKRDLDIAKERLKAVLRHRGKDHE
jgi:phage-related protein